MFHGKNTSTVIKFEINFPEMFDRWRNAVNRIPVNSPKRKKKVDELVETIWKCLNKVAQIYENRDHQW